MTCLFCEIIAGKIPATIVHETDSLIAIRDINPQAPTHILLIPKQHIDSVNDINLANAPIFADLLLAAKAVAKSEKISEPGYRLVFNINDEGGQEIHHLHLHLLGGRQMTWPPG